MIFCEDYHHVVQNNHERNELTMPYPFKININLIIEIYVLQQTTFIYKLYLPIVIISRITNYY